jgi:hypothetical protein
VVSVLLNPPPQNKYPEFLLVGWLVGWLVGPISLIIAMCINLGEEWASPYLVDVTHGMLLSLPWLALGARLLFFFFFSFC